MNQVPSQNTEKVGLLPDASSRLMDVYAAASRTGGADFLELLLEGNLDNGLVCPENLDSFREEYAAFCMSLEEDVKPQFFTFVHDFLPVRYPDDSSLIDRLGAWRDLFETGPIFLEECDKVDLLRFSTDVKILSAQANSSSSFFKRLTRAQDKVSQLATLAGVVLAVNNRYHLDRMMVRQYISSVSSCDFESNAALLVQIKRRFPLGYAPEAYSILDFIRDLIVEEKVDAKALYRMVVEFEDTLNEARKVKRRYTRAVLASSRTAPSDPGSVGRRFFTFQRFDTSDNGLCTDGRLDDGCFDRSGDRAIQAGVSNPNVEVSPDDFEFCEYEEGRDSFVNDTSGFPVEVAL